MRKSPEAIGLHNLKVQWSLKFPALSSCFIVWKRICGFHTSSAPLESLPRPWDEGAMLESRSCQQGHGCPTPTTLLRMVRKVPASMCPGLHLKGFTGAALPTYNTSKMLLMETQENCLCQLHPPETKFTDFKILPGDIFGLIVEHY